jgi:hypothetical protein
MNGNQDRSLQEDGTNLDEIDQTELQARASSPE